MTLACHLSSNHVSWGYRWEGSARGPRACCTLSPACHSAPEVYPPGAAELPAYCQPRDAAWPPTHPAPGCAQRLLKSWAEVPDSASMCSLSQTQADLFRPTSNVCAVRTVHGSTWVRPGVNGFCFSVLRGEEVLSCDLGKAETV